MSADNVEAYEELFRSEADRIAAGLLTDLGITEPRSTDEGNLITLAAESYVFAQLASKRALSVGYPESSLILVERGGRIREYNTARKLLGLKTLGTTIGKVPPLSERFKKKDEGITNNLVVVPQNPSAKDLARDGVLGKLLKLEPQSESSGTLKQVQNKRDYAKAKQRLDLEKEKIIRELCKGDPFCALCKTTEGPFELDHIDGNRDWDNKEIPSTARWKKLKEDHKAGKLRVLDRHCNRRLGGMAKGQKQY